MRTALVTGGAGYVGSVLVRLLLEQAWEVLVVDLGLFGWHGLEDVLDHPNLRVVAADVCHSKASWFDKVDVVFHLAGYSNDPMAAADPQRNYQYNAAGTAMVAQMTREAGVPRFILASSCSVYGYSPHRESTEVDIGRLNFPYAVSKLMAEEAARCWHDSAVILRFGTIYGYSPRMRFDLAVQAMMKSALKTGEIIVRDAERWRPFLHVTDAAYAYEYASRYGRGIYNIPGRNYQIGELAECVASTIKRYGLPRPSIVNLSEYDPRNYRVSDERMRKEWSWLPKLTVEEAMWEMLNRAQRDSSWLDDPRSINVTWLERRDELGVRTEEKPSPPGLGPAGAS